uniref:Acyl-CoA_dh_1 domain-containing protein n=1 Tax=Ascaris lumbricoides TaxID=6252 RepID=A0A0M3IV46_ASCLU
MRRISRNTGGDFETIVHPSLRESAALANKAVKEFGKMTEGLLLKHKKGIIDRQWELIRVADAAIDIYSMVTVLARYTRTANSKLGTAHEENIANLFCAQAAKRAMANIADIQMAQEKEIKVIGSIAADICKHGDLIQTHPIEWELIRVADAAIDIYSMVTVLARYTRTANSKLGTAHEENIANLFCAQAAKRAMANIADIQMAPEKEIKMIGSIAADICKHGDLIQTHPIEV